MVSDNIEKLAKGIVGIEVINGKIYKSVEVQDIANSYHGELVDITDVFYAFAKALQSSEPVAFAWYREGDAINPSLIEHINEHGKTVYVEFRMSTPPPNRGWKPTYTHPPASVPLEKYNKLLDAFRDQVGAKAEGEEG